MFRTTNPVQSSRSVSVNTSFRVNTREVMHTIAAGVALAGGFAWGLVIASDKAPETLSGGVNQGSADASLVAPLPCASEDSVNCFWDASEQGNGQGESFYVDDAGQIYRVGSAESPSDALSAYQAAVSDLIDSGASGGDLTPYLVKLAEVDNEIRFGD